MENDNQNIKKNDFFRLDYEGQLIKNSKKFDEWKKEQLSKYGSNAKLYKCNSDNGYFYSPIENSKYFSFDAKQCPSCNQQICYFCSRVTNINNEDDSHNKLSECCQTSNIYYLLFHKAKRFLTELDDDDIIQKIGYEQSVIKFYFPLYSFIYLVGIIFFCLFQGLIYKNNTFEEQYFKDDCASSTSIFINTMVGFLLSLIFFIYSIYFKLILILASVFFNKYPLKYYLGIINVAFQ